MIGHMLRLAPSHPPLWRTESSLQLGTDGAVRIDDITGWQEQLLDALIEGIPDAMLLPLARSLGAAHAEAERFVAEIGAALVPGPAERLVVRAELPSDVGFAESEAFAHGWRAAGLDTRAITPWCADDHDPRIPAIVVADGLVDPRRAAALMSSDTTHLPITLAGDRIVVGPVVVPGRSACLACLHAHRADADPTWPLVAAQLIGRARTPTDTGHSIEAAVLSARLLRRATATSAASLSVTLSATNVRRVWHAHRPHERCLCRSPEGTAIAPVHEIPTARPTTATATARRA